MHAGDRACTNSYRDVGRDLLPFRFPILPFVSFPSFLLCRLEILSKGNDLEEQARMPVPVGTGIYPFVDSDVRCDTVQSQLTCADIGPCGHPFFFPPLE